MGKSLRADNILKFAPSSDTRLESGAELGVEDMPLLDVCSVGELILPESEEGIIPL